MFLIDKTLTQVCDCAINLSFICFTPFGLRLRQVLRYCFRSYLSVVVKIFFPHTLYLCIYIIVFPSHTPYTYMLRNL